MLDVRRLRMLQHLATYGTVAATAEALHLTAPAVSQQLAVLEREAGLPVVEKHGRTLRLTPAGELLAAHAEVVLGDLAAAESDLAALRGGQQGVVRVAAFASAARTLLPAVWRSLGAPDERGRPALSLHLVEQEPELALASLRRREADLALVHSYSVLPRDFPAGCDHEVLLHDPVLLALHPRRAAALGLRAGAPADLAALSAQPWLTPAPDTSCYEMIQRACGAAGFVPAIRARSSDFAVLTALVAADAGAALVPRLALPDSAPPDAVLPHRAAPDSAAPDSAAPGVTSPDTAPPGAPAAPAPAPVQVSLHPLLHPVTRTVSTAIRSGTTRRPDLRRVLDLLREAAAGAPAGGPDVSGTPLAGVTPAG